VSIQEGTTGTITCLQGRNEEMQILVFRWFWEISVPAEANSYQRIKLITKCILNMSGLDGNELHKWVKTLLREEWEDGWNGHDGHKLARLFHDDGTYWDSTVGVVPRGKIGQMIAKFDEELPDFVFAVHFDTVTSMRRSKEAFNVTLRWTMLGADGKLKLPGIDFLEFEGDKIKRATTYLCARQLKNQGLGMDKVHVPTDTQDAIEALKQRNSWQPQLTSKY